MLASATTCSDISEKIERARNHPELSPEARAEVIDLYQNDLTEVLGLKCDWDANADWRNGAKIPTTLGEKPMTKVTYRGVQYDAEEYNAKVVAEATQRERHDLMYRGIKVKSKASPCS